MDKFKRAKNGSKSLMDEANMFADTVDKIARERAAKILMCGKKFLPFESPVELASKIGREVENQHEKIKCRSDPEEMDRFYTGFKFLYAYWVKRNELEVKLEDLLGNISSYVDFDEYTTGLVIEKSLEKIISALSMPMGDFERILRND